MDARNRAFSPSSAISEQIKERQYWQRKLGKLLLGAEPLEIQLENQRRATWVLTLVAAGIGLMFLALFSAFRAPLTGAIVAGVLVLPIIALAWLRFAKLRRRVHSYLQKHQ
ncbi:hypothetical protein BH23PLA1_BH23PLA1_42760 [soil metagenome]